MPIRRGCLPTRSSNFLLRPPSAKMAVSKTPSEEKKTFDDTDNAVGVTGNKVPSGWSSWFGGSKVYVGPRISPLKANITESDSDDTSSAILKKQLELEAGCAIQYRTCSWQKVRLCRSSSACRTDTRQTRLPPSSSRSTSVWYGRPILPQLVLLRLQLKATEPGADIRSPA